MKKSTESKSRPAGLLERSSQPSLSGVSGISQEDDPDYPRLGAISQQEVLSWPRPSKLCGIAERCGFGRPVLAAHNARGKWIRMKFSSGLEILVRPRHVEIRGQEIVDEDLEEYLKGAEC